MSKEPSEILAALYLLYKDHFRNLQNAGYSHKEGFWLGFACLPFLPWDERAEDEIRLSQVLRLYSGIYQYYVDATIKAEKENSVHRVAQGEISNGPGYCFKGRSFTVGTGIGSFHSTRPE
jgi:hypothetical protein